MLRRWLIALIALALPFAIYWLYQRLERRHVSHGGEPWPFAILWLTGLVLAVETLFAAALIEPRQPENYTPPYLAEDRARPGPEE